MRTSYKLLDERPAELTNKSIDLTVWKKNDKLHRLKLNEILNSSTVGMLKINDT